METFWTFLYYTVAVLTITSFFMSISYIMPGVKSNDLLPYQVFLVALGILNLTLQTKKSNIF